MAAILVVDDELSARSTLALLLKKRGHRVTQAEGLTAAVRALNDGAFELVVTDLRMPDGSGIDILRAVKTHCSEADVILLTAYAGWESAKEAMQLGALDYFEKGREPDELFHRIDRALSDQALRREQDSARGQMAEGDAVPGIVYRSSAMRRVLDIVARVAPTDATVLIHGASGTGKELIARAIHRGSRRARKPFVALNCGALPETLLESELFGHVKGAFTGASVKKKGLFEEADGGTVFLDEIGEMAPALQVKLLRTLQDGEVRAVGSIQPITVDTRVLAATNQNLDVLMRQGRFREDLFYRLNVIAFAIPPLRERREDIPLLVDYFLDRFNRKQGRALRLEDDALQLLVGHPWPGNVRELEHALERMVILGEGDTITIDDLPFRIANGGEAELAAPSRGSLADTEKAHIREMLERHGWNYSRTADALGISRTTLWRKLKEYGFSR
ncbi:MAG TPA: sigma-54 dependent transcriptional regulator [Methylomirabilota bacterium]|nr:sigma-54 dependent transcriptional regulator [Methylomirabilota bacterium]